jgi:hypothetical protein
LLIARAIRCTSNTAQKRDTETKMIKLGPCGFNRGSTKQRLETKTRVELLERERERERER